jgi:polyribonucleotide 5'-hydroxyl-kinase
MLLVNVLFILGSERLYSDMVRRFDKKKTSTDELISVIKLDKSGGCVDRDDSFMKQMRQTQIRIYFFGDVRTTLSPHTQMVDFSQMTIFKFQEPDTVNLSLLPGGAEDEGVAPPIFEKMEPTPMMQNAILAIMYANLNDPEEDIRDASVMGFVYVADVDEKKRKVKVLAPVSGRLPAKPFVWGTWPEGPSDLVA